MKAALAALTMLAVARPTPAFGQDSAFSLRAWLRPRATLRSAVWSSSRMRDDRGPLIGSVVWADLAPRVSAGIEVRFAGWAGVGSLGAAAQHDVEARLRELYGRFALGPVDIRLGKQIIAWGRADAINPTDNLSPDDLTQLVPDDDDQKGGVPAAQAALTVGGTTVTAIWLADFQGHSLPIGSLQQREPRNAAAQGGAVRLERSGGRVDWSASYFSGLDLTPDIDSAFVVSYHRLHVFGADAAAAVGRYGLRAEAAWILTEDRSGRNPEIKNPTFYAVVGADRTFGGYLNVNVQYAVRRVRGFGAPTEGAPAVLARISQQLRRVQHGATVRISNQWWHETLAVEIAGLLLSPPWQLSMRPRVTYAVTDAWHLRAGADLVDGRPGTLLHDMKANRLAFLEIRRGL